jgi:hypothetical protein
MPLERRSYSIHTELKGDKCGGMLRCGMDATVWAGDGDAAKGPEGVLDGSGGYRPEVVMMIVNGGAPPAVIIIFSNCLSIKVCPAVENFRIYGDRDIIIHRN